MTHFSQTVPSNEGSPFEAQRSRLNNPNLQRNINTTAAAGAVIVGVATAVVVANIIGFPVVPAGELALATSSGGLVLLLTAQSEAAMAVFMSGLAGASYGMVAGGALGALRPTHYADTQ